MRRRFLDKGDLSNLLSLGLLLTGLAARSAGIQGSEWLVAVGLFGFAGGMTNWLAVKMLFDRVPLLYGSGVIPARFREIRAQICDLIMRHFFAADYLARYLAARPIGGIGLADLEERVRHLLHSEEVEAAIDTKIAELSQSSIGAMLQMVGPARIKALVRDFIDEVGIALADPLRREVSGVGPDPAVLRSQVEQLLTTKLEELDPETVKRMMEEVIREHLGWLIVWGNVFGGAFGLLSRALGYAWAGG